MMRFAFIFYRTLLSPDSGLLRYWFVGGCCRFFPSCSRYAEEFITRRGFFPALPHIAWRILRCNPWSSGGYDPVNSTDQLID